MGCFATGIDPCVEFRLFVLVHADLASLGGRFIWNKIRYAEMDVWEIFRAEGSLETLAFFTVGRLLVSL